MYLKSCPIMSHFRTNKNCLGK
uniref:Uncharacterized protein n=1 Tax=Anguilla anguilla TaxID=7936 RepID=A0A0E9PV25_ANGAN